MDRWLAAVEADHGSASLATKIIRDRPSDIQDRCTQVDLLEIRSRFRASARSATCPTLQTRYGTPHTVAGESIATDSNKCTLKPLRRTDYYPIAFSDSQWARLQSAFPTGVCDWSRPGVSQQGAIPWQTYQDSAGNVVYGGRGLGPAPSNVGTGWTSDSFGSWRN